MGLDNPLHIAFIVVILLLVFGARRLPEIGRSLGAGMREFKDSVTGESRHATLPPGPQQTQAVQQPAAQQPQPAVPPQAPAQQPPAPAQQPPAPAPEAASPTGADVPPA